VQDLKRKKSAENVKMEIIPQILDYESRFGF
jgi:hypothetical protein